MGTKFFLIFGIICVSFIRNSNSEPIQNDQTTNSVKSSRSEQWKLKRSLFPSQYSSPIFTSFQSSQHSNPITTVYSPIFPVGVYSSPVQQQIISSFGPPISADSYSVPSRSSSVDSYSIPSRSSPVDSYSIPQQEQKPERSFGIPNLSPPSSNYQTSPSLSFNSNIYKLPLPSESPTPSKPNQYIDLPSEAPTQASYRFSSEAPSSNYGLPSETPSSTYGVPSAAPTEESQGYPTSSQPQQSKYTYEIPKTNAWTVITSTVPPTQEYKIAPKDVYDPTKMKWKPLKEVTWSSVKEAYDEQAKGGYGYPESSPSTEAIPTETYGPPKETYGPPKDTYGPPKDTYGPPKETYGPPKETYGPPKETYGPPKETYGPPKETYGPPKVTYGPPKETYGPPKETYGPPKETYGPPKETYGPPKETYGPPKETYGPPKETYGPPKETYGPPKETYGPPKETYGPPKETYGPPPKETYGPPKETKPSGGYGGYDYTEFSPNSGYGPIEQVTEKKKEIRFIIHKPGEEEEVKATVLEDSKKAGEEVSFIRGPWIELDHKQKVWLPPPKKTVVYILLKEPQIKTTVQVNEPKPSEMPKPEVFIVYENSDGVIRKHYDLSPDESQKVASLLGDKIRYSRDSMGPHAILMSMHKDNIAITTSATTTTTIKPPRAEERERVKTKKTSQ